ncbi:MAG: macro domain-containing protein, partial [Oscillospiraceae bacterium]
NLAQKAHCHTVAFPSISTGIYRFPLPEAAKIAVSEILRFLKPDCGIETVYMVCFDPITEKAYQKALQELS